MKRQLKPGADPVFTPKRPVPYAVQHIVEAEIGRLEAEGIISRVNYGPPDRRYGYGRIGDCTIYTP